MSLARSKYFEDSRSLGRPYLAGGSLMIVIGIVAELAAFGYFFDGPPSWQKFLVVLGVSIILVVGITHLLTGIFLRRRKLIGIYFGITVSSLWIVLGVLCVFGALSSDSVWPIIFIGGGLIWLPALEIRALWAARQVFLDEADWQREGLPAAKGFELLMRSPSQPIVSDRGK